MSIRITDALRSVQEYIQIHGYVSAATFPYSFEEIEKNHRAFKEVATRLLIDACWDASSPEAFQKLKSFFEKNGMSARQLKQFKLR